MNAEIHSKAIAEIRSALDSWLNATRSGNLDAIVAHYAPDIVAFDAIQALQFRGVAAYKKHWQACLEMCPAGMTFEVPEPSIAVNGDLAFCHALISCGSTDENGVRQAMWSRMTACYRKIGGRWLVVHEHFSLPFDGATSKVLADLQP